MMRRKRMPTSSRRPPHSHDGLALQFSARHGQDLRYVSVWGRWLMWDGTRWKLEETLRAYDFARALAREQAGKLKAGAAKEITSAATIAAIEKLARADRRHASTTGVWDADPWLLKPPDGPVELKTGELSAHRRGDLLTKSTAVGPRGDCLLWLAFLNQIFAGDQDLSAFMQRVAGYSLTGSIEEHALIFAHGPGGNGKGTFLNTFYAILGD